MATMAITGAAVVGGCAVLGEQCCHQFVGTLPSLSLSSSSRAGYRGGVKQRSVPAVRASNAEGPLRRPSAPGAAPSIATSPAPPSPPTSEPSPSPSPSPVSSSAAAAPTKVTPSKSTAVSIEYQRQRAKELQEYFLDRKYEEQVRADRVLGWTRKNEIANGRWSMFGIAVGLLTEYATGSDFVEQLKIIISNLGIAELD
ncbi:hypothetical protein KC19_9G141800 [Ceratodon purpureus]|uniref:Uncharacterized protein n=1 Tax=Ceratodon purpureus TaxID=3225 RepID=A0A8T0GTZ3_CERPU|nr:hypothetical protein KC19_9G141800 [Ceratodon purpureus]